MEITNTSDETEPTYIETDADDERLLSIRETAEKLGYTYRSFAQARVEGRVLLEEVRPSDSERGRPKYRLSDVRRVQRGEIKAMRAAPFSEADRQRTHERTASIRAERKAGISPEEQLQRSAAATAARKARELLLVKKNERATAREIAKAKDAKLRAEIAAQRAEVDRLKTQDVSK